MLPLGHRVAARAWDTASGPACGSLWGVSFQRSGSDLSPASSWMALASSDIKLGPVGFTPDQALSS